MLDPEWGNAGPAPQQLILEAITPVSRFFARNHAAVPALDPATWRLRVHGLVHQELSLSLDDLRTGYQRYELPATLVCAGLRRAELIRHRPIPGELEWDLEPAGAAVWSGVALRDVLRSAGVLDGALHLGFTGLDQVERHGRPFGFGGSIPRAKALAAEVLLADTMNGQPLLPVHGAPLRLVVPGYIGARSVKWLAAVEARATPSDNYFQAEAYRVLREPDPAAPRDVRTGSPLGELPLNAMILVPRNGATVPAGEVRLRGWAMGGSSLVYRVEISADGGARWIDAALEPGLGRWAWRRWDATVRLVPGSAELVVRAWDDACLGQPASVAEVWNVKGYGNNAWHRITVRVLP